jgi:hypothetical protein
VILLVESDAGCGQALARLGRRSGDRVRLVRTPGAAVAAAQRESYDVAVVDLFVKGGGVALARRLTRHVPRVYLSVGPKLLTDELLESAIGFPVLRKRDLPGLIGPAGHETGRGAGSRSALAKRSRLVSSR